jgi:hypothetical protein
MPGMRQLLMLTSVVGVVVFGATAVAVAEEYCVGTSGGTCTQTPADLQTALSAAHTNPGDDTVRLGPGIYTAATSNGFTYGNGGAGDVAIIGAGQGVTTLTEPGDDGMNFHVNELLHLNSPGSTSSVRDLALSLPAPTPPDTGGSQYRGLALYGQTQVTSVAVTAPQVASNSYGIWVGLGGPSSGGATIIDSTVSINKGSGGPGSTGILVDQPLTLIHSTVTADTAVSIRAPVGGMHSISRSTLRGLTPLSASQGTVDVSNSVLDLGSNNATAAAVAGNSGFPSTVAASFDNTTIAATGSNTNGILVSANDATAADAVSATITNTVISGATRAILVSSGNGDTATASTDYSNYNPSSTSVAGAGSSFNGGANDTNLAPQFVDSANGNFHLMPSSALIDIGDPTPPPGGAVDIDGDARGLIGIFPDCPSGPGRRDMGADEFVPDCTPPDTAITAGPASGASISDSTPTFTFTSTEAPAVFRCSVDGAPPSPCPSPFTTTTLADGTHTLAVQAIDPNQNVDPTAATRTLIVDTKAPDTTITGRSKVKAKRKRATVALILRSDPGVTFECSLDGAAFASCKSPFSASLRRGRHTLTARATDAAGNVETSPAVFSVRVVKKKPKKR